MTLSGIVTQVVGRQEGAQFASDVFLIADGVLPGETVEVAEITVSRVEPEIYVPAAARAPRSAGPMHAERDHALFFDEMEHRVPIGLGRDGEPLFANLEFLDGTRGAHVNISGISGVATKTTYATFLLYSLFHSGVLGAEAVNTKALIFNVKGEDLLFLDQPNGKLDEDQQDRYRTLGLAPGPFESVGGRSRRRGEGDPNAGPDVATRTTGVSHLLLDHRRLRRERAAAVRVRRRRGRAPAVHDGDPQRRPEAQARRRAGRRRRRVAASRARRSPPTRELVDLIVDRLHRRRDDVRLGRARGRHGHDQRVRPPAPVVAARAGAARARRRPAPARPSRAHR